MIKVRLQGGAFDGVVHEAKAGAAELYVETLSPSPYGILLPDDEATLKYAIRKGTHPSVNVEDASRYQLYRRKGRLDSNGCPIFFAVG